MVGPLLLPSLAAAVMLVARVAMAVLALAAAVPLPVLLRPLWQSHGRRRERPRRIQARARPLSSPCSLARATPR